MGITGFRRFVADLGLLDDFIGATWRDVHAEIVDDYSDHYDLRNGMDDMSGDEWDEVISEQYVAAHCCPAGLEAEY